MSKGSFLQLTRTLHIYLTMFSSIVLFLFALTGFMLNHGKWFGLGGRPPAASGAAEHGKASVRGEKNGPPGAARPEQKRGLLTKLTSLHKGKPAQLSVVLLIDVTAGVLMLGSITGVILLLSLSKRRRLGLIVMGAGTIGALMIYLLVIP